jgi:hypothetical protein
VLVPPRVVLKQLAPNGRSHIAAAQEDGKKTAFSICDCLDLRIAPAA